MTKLFRVRFDKEKEKVGELFGPIVFSYRGKLNGFLA